MSDFYKTSSGEGTKNLYQKSLIYKLDISDANYENLKDFNFAEKYLYGRVNRNYVPIEIDISRSIFKGLPQTNKNDASGFQAVNFVADAFSDLVMQFRKKIATGQINAKDPFLSELNVNRAYESPRTLYRNLHLGNKETIEQMFLQGDFKFQTFDQFINQLIPVLQDLLQLVPFTYPAFIKSTLCPMEASGLVIDIANQSTSNDEQKIKLFKESPNWNYYLNVCRSYGFSVDANVPWRLVADIGSSEMIQYARNYGYNSTNQILFTAYTPAYITYYENFKDIILELYNRVKRDYIDIKYCQDGTVMNQLIRPVSYERKNLTETYTERQFLDLYMKVRLMEEKEIAQTPHEIKETVRQCMQMIRTREPLEVVALFENSIAPTFNNSGSLTDVLKRVKIAEEERANVLSDT